MSTVFPSQLDDSGMLRIAFDLPESNVNIFNTTSVAALEALTEQLENRQDVAAAYVVSAKQNSFCVGADINGINQINSIDDAYEKSRYVQKLFERWNQLPFPTLIAIDGPCVGGGTEWALAFDYIVATNHRRTRIGLPEIKLGIIPGWGGTVRLPGRIGLQNALTGILTGRLYRTEHAYKLGLVDSVLPVENYETNAKTFLQRCLADAGRAARKRRKKLRRKRSFLEKTPFTRPLIYKFALRRALKESGGHYPAIEKAIASIRNSVGAEISEALDYEARRFMQVAAGDVCKNLVSVYLLTEYLKDQPHLETRDLVLPKPLQIAVGGSNTASQAISMLALPTAHIRLVDNDATKLGESVQYLKSERLRRVNKRVLSKREMQAQLDGFSITRSSAHIGAHHIRISTEAEMRDRHLQPAIGKTVSGKTIDLVHSNGVPIQKTLSEGMSEETTAGIQIFDHCRPSGVVEIVCSDKTTPQTRDITIQLVKQWRKMPLLVSDTPGFLVNRILLTQFASAVTLIAHGGNVAKIDRHMRQLGYAQGPFELMDGIGLGQLAEISRACADIQPHVYEILGGLGSENESFYMKNTKGRGGVVNRKRIRQISVAEPPNPLSSDQIERLLIYPMVSEAATCLTEQVVADPRDIDAASVFAMGFPPFRGGLLRDAEKTGLGKIVEMLEGFQENFGEVFAPSRALREAVASEAGRFYA